jgi:hypothetical protein
LDCETLEEIVQRRKAANEKLLDLNDAMNKPSWNIHGFNVEIII